MLIKDDTGIYQYNFVNVSYILKNVAIKYKKIPIY